jgi:hypothetical protein
MYDKLIDLADYLDDSGLDKEAIAVDNLVKISLMGPSPQKIREYQSQPKDTKPLHFLLDLVGLIPGVGEGADLANAALYLAEGITTTNLLMAALSVTSMVPGLGDTAKVIKYGAGLAPEITKGIAKLILKHKERIKFSFTKLKEQKSIAYLEKLVPQGRNLSAYSDRMFEALRTWAYNIVNTGVKSEVGESIEENFGDNESDGRLDEAVSRL